MNTNKMCSILFYVAAVCNYITAINYFFGSDTSMGAVYLGLGSTFLSLGSFWLSKMKKENKDKQHRK